MLRPTLAARLLALSLASLILCACEVSAATCGDGLQEEGEQCEDGNQVYERNHLHTAVLLLPYSGTLASCGLLVLF